MNSYNPVMTESMSGMSGMSGGKGLKRKPVHRPKSTLTRQRIYHNKLMKHFGGFFEDGTTVPVEPVKVDVQQEGGKKKMKKRVRRVGGAEELEGEQEGGKKKMKKRVRRVGGAEELEGGAKKMKKRVRRVGGAEELEGGAKKMKKRVRRSASPVRRR